MKQLAGLLILMMITMLATGCEGELVTRNPNVAAAPVHYLLFVDLSGSVHRPHLKRWLRQAQTAILPKLRCGDRLTVLPLHNDTARAGVLFDGVTPIFEGEDTISERLACRKALQTVVHRFTTELTTQLSDFPPATRTDILHVVTRIEAERAASSRQTMVWIASDFQNDSPELRLEHTPLQPQAIEGLVDTLVSQNGWTATTLETVVIHCWVEAYRPGDRVPVNDFARLKRFWVSLFTKVGASVQDFTTV